MGNYINNNLIKDEYLIYETNYHWILYFNHLIPSIITLGIYPYLISKFSEFGITNKRLIIKTGILSRKTLELNLSKINIEEIQKNNENSIKLIEDSLNTQNLKKTIHDYKVTVTNILNNAEKIPNFNKIEIQFYKNELNSL